MGISYYLNFPPKTTIVIINILLNNQRVKKKSGENRKYFKINENEDETYKNV